MMMFDPPDYPYKDLSETYEDLLLSKTNADTTVSETNILETTNISFQSNDSGRYFNVENSFQSKEGTVVQTESLLNYEPTLLDEITVNQFLLPLQDSACKNNEEIENLGPDLLALHSCVICHDIFTTESDLLDHTIAFHASINILEQNASNEVHIAKVQSQTTTEEGVNTGFVNSSGFETGWLVCRICQRVLSTALEVEPKEQLCCVDMNGKCSVSTRLLHTMFVCDLCSGLFADGEALDKHKLSCCEDNNLYDETVTLNSADAGVAYNCPEVCLNCDICCKQHSSTEPLTDPSLEYQKPRRNVRKNRVFATVNSNKMWNCGSCNQLFATARELYKHKRGEDRPAGAPLTAYVCDECDKVLGSMCALHTHKKMHKVFKPGYPCRICGRRFNQSGHLAIHMRMHTGERPYPCDLCPKAFKVKVERDDHRRTHTGERPFACSACPKTFTAAARLREHARIHTDQRPYRCDICGAAFRRPYARTVHTLIHTGEKPHECDICGTAFRRSGDMWKHKRTLHGV